MNSHGHNFRPRETGKECAPWTGERESIPEVEVLERQAGFSESCVPVLYLDHGPFLGLYLSRSYRSVRAQIRMVIHVVVQVGGE